MRTRLLLLTLTSSLIACGADNATVVPLETRVNTGLGPGEAGTLLELTDGSHYIHSFVVTANYLYFAVPWAGVYRMPKYGGDVVPVDQDRNGLFRHVAADGDGVYWDYITFDGNSTRTRVRGQTAAGSPPATIVDGVFGIADSSSSSWFQAGGGILYWVADGSGHGEPGVAIEWVPASGGTPQTLLAFDDINGLPYWIAGDAGIYFTSVSALQSRVDDCTVHEFLVPGSGQGGLALLGNCPTPDSVALGSAADVVYLRSEHAIWQMQKRDRNAPPTAIQTFADDTALYNVASDESRWYANLYSDAAGGWSWVTFPKTGGEITPLADASVCPNIGSSAAVATDSQYLYLLCGAFGRIVVVPKPVP